MNSCQLKTIQLMQETDAIKPNDGVNLVRSNLL